MLDLFALVLLIVVLLQVWGQGQGLQVQDKQDKQDKKDIYELFSEKTSMLNQL
jgi:hypothetical protein